MQARHAGRKHRPSKRRRRTPKIAQRPVAQPSTADRPPLKPPQPKPRAARTALRLRAALAAPRLTRERRALALASLGILLLLTFCSMPRFGVPPPHDLALVPVDFAALPGWSRDRIAEAMPALRNSCDAFARLPDDRPVGPAAGPQVIPQLVHQQGQPTVGGRVADWRPACQALGRLQPGDDAGARQFLTGYFQPFEALDREREVGLFTGYYETELDGARQPGGAYTVPLYRAPAAPVSFSRAEIDAGALKGKGLELLWLKDPVDAFLLQIQGSGLVRLPDGRLTRVGYAGNNGRDFVPVGRLMLQAGILPKNQASMQAIRDWLKAHPAEAAQWMQKNPRYIFFRELAGDSGALAGPSGALGVTLTPTRSMAVDPDFLPLGAPVWLDTTAPDGTPLQRLMVAQDVGSAIKGPVRGDLFWGTGAPALEFAGRMKSRGRYYVLLPKTVAPRSTLTASDITRDGTN